METFFPQNNDNHTLNCRGRLLDLRVPVVMGILNVTPDSFFDGGKHFSLDTALRQAEQMLREGATIIDVGGASSRPGAPTVPLEEELRRVLPVVQALAERFPEAYLSVDTWRAVVAQAALSAGAHLVNDISAGRFEPEIFAVCAEARAPIVLMHMQGTPETMQQQPVYQDVVTEIFDFFLERIAAARAAGVVDLVLDPGFGFGKTIPHNFELLRRLADFRLLGCPVLVGVSRKSFIYKTLNTTTAEALNGTTALHAVALSNGGQILRVHDVKAARETVQLLGML